MPSSRSILFAFAIGVPLGAGAGLLVRGAEAAGTGAAVRTISIEDVAKTHSAPISHDDEFLILHHGARGVTKDAFPQRAQRGLVTHDPKAVRGSRTFENDVIGNEFEHLLNVVTVSCSA